MKPEQRRDWIEGQLRENRLRARGGVDVLDADFVNEYIAATGASYRATMYGAYKCDQLGRDLADMVKLGVLKRSRAGVSGMAGMGFPRWVWSYRPVHTGAH